MKLFLVSLLCATGLAATTQAQVLSDRAARNLLLGGVAGAIIGENNDHRAVEGALIGATAGLAWTALTEDGHREVVYSDPRPCPPERVVYERRGRDCDDRTVVIVRPEPRRCDPPAKVIVVNPHNDRRTVIVRDHDRRPDRVIIVDNDRRDRRPDKVIIVDNDDRRGHRGDRVIVYDEGRRPRVEYRD